MRHTVPLPFFLVIWCLMLAAPVMAQRKKVMTMQINAEIDPRMNRYVALALGKAKEIQADVIVIEMDTYGGVLTDAKDIVDQLSQVTTPLWVFINSDAASAGALIAIACDSIYMSPGASIGAATVVDGSGERALDKYQSYMRAIMRATAEENHRNPDIAEAMVDERVELDSLKKPGQVVTLSTSEAIKNGYCEGRVNDTEEILRKNGVTSFDIVPFELSASDKIVSFFLNPFISGILILVIMAGIYFELQTPGIGFAGAVALVALILYLVPYYLNGLAEYWEIIAFFVGLALLAAEIFIIPGFGVVGFAGVVLTISSLVLIMINNDAFDFEFVRMDDILTATAATIAGLLGSMVLLFVGGAKLANTRFYRRVALTSTQASAEGFTANILSTSLTGKQGVAFTVLRPSGKVQIGEQIYDAFSRGEYIDVGQHIEVVGLTGSSLQVRKASH